MQPEVYSMKQPLLYLILIVLCAVIVQGCGEGGEEQTAEGEDYLAARVGEWTLTKEFLYDVISRLPDHQREKYDTPGGRANFTDDFINEQLYYLEAERLNMEQKSEIQEQLEEAKRAILIQAYYKEYVDGPARPSKEEMHEYYEMHMDMYTSLPVVRAQHIFSRSKEKLEGLKKRIIEGGEKMTTLAHQYSEDALTMKDGGDLGFFNEGGFIRGVGFSEAFSDTVFKMDVGEVYGPILWDKGYSLVRVNEKRAAEPKPFEDVESDISTRLTKQKIDTIKREVTTKLRGDFEWHNYMDQYYRSVQRSPEELFEYAQNTNDPYDRIAAFEEIVEKFPEDKHAPQALFMIGFVHVEELGDKTIGRRYFSKLIAQYPDSDVAESARWMTRNLDKPLPDFEDIDELNKKLSDESDESDESE
jgi:peptidyl-prolyl cis-trans isomerase C